MLGIHKLLNGANYISYPIEALDFLSSAPKRGHKCEEKDDECDDNTSQCDPCHWGHGTPSHVPLGVHCLDETLQNILLYLLTRYTANKKSYIN